MTELVAIYGAIIATLSIGWQAYTWFKRTRTVVSIRVNCEKAPPGNTGGASAGDYALYILIANRSQFEISVVQFWFEHKSGRVALLARDRILTGAIATYGRREAWLDATLWTSHPIDDSWTGRIGIELAHVDQRFYSDWFRAEVDDVELVRLSILDENGNKVRWTTEVNR
jgi:hypothetical protein